MIGVGNVELLDRIRSKVADEQVLVIGALAQIRGHWTGVGDFLELVLVSRGAAKEPERIIKSTVRESIVVVGIQRPAHFERCESRVTYLKRLSLFEIPDDHFVTKVLRV